MSQDQIAGMLRIIVPTILSWAVARGWISTEQSGQLLATTVNACLGIIALASVLWSFYANSRNKMISRTAAMPEVQMVIADSHIADGDLRDDPKVQSR